MASRVWLTPGYIIPRWSLWTLLLILAVLDGLFHRRVRSRGYQLYLALTLTTFLYCLREAFLLAWSLLGVSAPHVLRSGSFGAFIFFSDVADATFIGVMIAIAAGYCITRTNLGPHRGVVLTIPSIFLATSLVVDYVLYALRGQDAFSDLDTSVVCIGDGDTSTVGGGQVDPTTGLSADPLSDPTLPCSEEVSPLTGIVFFICIVANMMAFMMAWFYVFDTAQKERDVLEDSAAAIPAGEGSSLDGGDGGRTALPGGRPAAVGHTATGGESNDHTVFLQEGTSSHLYGSAAEADPQAPKTIQDKVELREKLRLIRAFFAGVSLYVLATLLVLFIPVFVPTVVDRVILALQNGLLFILLASLLVVFRMRQGNSYLVLQDAAIGDTSTELGVLGRDEEAGYGYAIGAAYRSGRDDVGSDAGPPASRPAAPPSAAGPGASRPGAAAPGKAGARAPAVASPGDGDADPPPPRFGSLGARRLSAPASRAPAASPTPPPPGRAERDAALDAAFTLDDEDEEDLGLAPPRAGSRVNLTAARAGVLVQELPGTPTERHDREP